MLVDKVDIPNITVSEPECDSPIGGDPKGPEPRSIAAQGMKTGYTVDVSRPLASPGLWRLQALAREALAFGTCVDRAPQGSAFKVSVRAGILRCQTG